MTYLDEDIEFAQRLLSRAKQTDDKTTDEWIDDPAHTELLKELAAVYEVCNDRDFSTDTRDELIRLRRSLNKQGRRQRIFRWSVAASVILLIGLFSEYLISVYRETSAGLASLQTEQTTPYRSAELILADGQRIILHRQENQIRGVKETNIRHDSLNELNYMTAQIIEGEIQTEEIYNTLCIPTGGFYRLILSDGSRVWLNSVTELRYPVNFNGIERKVKLSGEAYFEVSPDSTRPFIVVTDDVEIRVYGTAFNVNTYRKGCVQTTLVRGKVGVRQPSTDQETLLCPGQLAEYTATGRQIRVKEVDPYNYIAWKDGEFIFQGETIEEIMERLGRWYDMEVIYANETVRWKRFTGIIDRYEELEKILRLMEGPATLRFEVKGRNVTVREAGQ